MDTTDPTVPPVQKTITVKDDKGVKIAEGTLVVTTSANPVTATFQPENGTQTDCNPGVVWTEGPSGVVKFNFPVSGTNNGAFPLSSTDGDFTYKFTGNQNANGAAPFGTVNFPTSDPDNDDIDPWQSSA